jgi:hypothetical protein
MTCDNLELLKILRNINFDIMLMNILRQKLQSPYLEWVRIDSKPIHKVAIYIVNLDFHKEINVLSLN